MMSFDPVCQLCFSYFCFDVWLAVSPICEGWLLMVYLEKVYTLEQVDSIFHWQIGNLCEEYLISTAIQLFPPILGIEFHEILCYIL
jgi:hypothetical protein